MSGTTGKATTASQPSRIQAGLAARIRADATTNALQRGLAALLLGVSFIVPTHANAGVRIKARSDGFPGASQNTASKISVAVSKKSMRILNPASFTAILINLEADDFSECYAIDKVVQKRTVKSFNEIRDKRRATRAKKIAQAQKLSGEQRAKALAVLAKEGIREDGKILAKSTPGKKAKSFNVRVNGLIRTYECQRVDIRENSARDPIFRVWFTKQIPLKEDVLSFYRFGTFSKSVVAELSKIEGFPVRIEAVVDDGNFRKEVFFEVSAVESEEIPAWWFVVPDGFKKVPDINKYLEAKRKKNLQKNNKEYRCPQTGKVVKNLNTAPRFRDPRTGKRYYFFNKKARLDFIRNLGKRGKKAGQKNK